MIGQLSRAPFSAVEIEINSSCNRSCSYCPNSIEKRKVQGEQGEQGEIDARILSKLLDELHELDFRGRISYDFYNEPLLHSDFDSVVRATRAALPLASIETYTNGTLLNERRLRHLLDAGVSRFIVTRHEAETDFQFEREYQRLPPELKSRVLYRGYSELRLTNRGGLLKHLGGKAPAFAPCRIPEFLVLVTVSGNVLPCFEDFREALVMGNLGNQSLMEIWSSPPYETLRKNLRMGLRHAYPPCSECNRMEVLPPANSADSGQGGLNVSDR